MSSDIPANLPAQDDARPLVSGVVSMLPAMRARLQGYRTKDADADLVEWISKVRKLHALNELPRDFVDDLNSLDFEWSHDEGCWARMLRSLSVFIETEGHALPSPSGATKKLAHWVYAQRALRAASRLSGERIAKLDSVGFEWSAHAARWTMMLARLAAHREAKGCIHFNWSNDSSLARWSRAQRREYRADRLTPGQVKGLESIGFKWEAAPVGDKWRSKFAELLSYKAAHGDCNVPIKYAPNVSLGVWVYHQRQFRKKGILSSEREKQLVRAGFCWGVRESAWERQFECLKRYAHEHGHCRIDGSQPSLAAWSHDQRKSRTEGRLTQPQVDKLDSVGFVWERRGVGGRNPA